MKRAFIPLVLMLAIFGLWGFRASAEAVIRAGTINDRTPFVEIPITVDVNNSTVLVDMQATSGDLDSLLYLVDANGTIVAENDDIIPGNLDAYLVFPRALAGDYTVIATRLRVTEGDSQGDFRININIGEPDEPALEYAVSPEDLLAVGFPELEPRPIAEWTILAYYGGDTNLEAGVLRDFKEFELGGGSTESVRIVGLLDRNPGYSDASDDWSTARLFELQADISGDNLTLDSEPLADLGVLDTGNGETFAQFLVWGIRHYPAQRYAIALSSHGGAWQGIITDDTSGSTILTLPELNAALEIAKQEAGVSSFDVLINDACSMSSIEYYTQVAPHFAISLASPEIVVSPALDMTIFTEALNSNPNFALNELGQDLIDVYMTRDIAQRAGQDNNYLNFAVTDLDHFDPVISATEHFAALINRDPLSNSNLIGSARSNTYTYSSFLGQDERIDLGDFMRQVIAISSDSEIVQAARDVLTALDTSRIYGNAAERVRESVSYYNIYFPSQSTEFDSAYLVQSPLQNWSQMLRAYYNATTPQLWQVENSLLAYHPPITPKVTVTQVFPQVSSTDFPPAISVEIVGRRIASGAFTIDRILDDGTVIRLAETDILTQVVRDNQVHFINNWRSGVDQSVFHWLPFTLPVISDGTTQANELLTRRDNVVALEGRYRASDQDNWNDVTLLFDAIGRVENIISQNQSGGLASIEIPVGSEFQAYRFLVTADGEINPVPGTLYTWVEGGLIQTEAAAQSGQYNLGFFVRAFGGVTGFDSVTITVNNDNATPEWAGYTDVSLGLNFLRPADWSPVVDFGNLLSSTSPDGNSALRVYYISADDNTFQILRNIATRFELRIPLPAEALYLNNEPFGLVFDYNYFTDDGNTWNGRGAVFYRDTALGGQGFVFAVETLAGTGQIVPRDQLPAFLDGLNVFDAAALQADAATEWHYEFLTNRRIAYPVPNAWNSVPDGIWTNYLPPDAVNPTTMITVAEYPGTDAQVALEQILADFVADGTSETRIYRGETHNWNTAAYTIRRRDLDRNGRVYDQMVTGRVYVTEINSKLYAIRFETPDNAFAPFLFRTVFEPMVDGFAPGTQEFSTGTRSSFIKAAVVSAGDVCQAIPQNSLCWGGGSSVRVRYTDEEKDAAALLTQAGDNAPLEHLLAFQVGVLDDGTIDPYSVAVVDLKGNLPDDTDQSVRLIVFGGTTIVNRAVIGGDENSRVAITSATGGTVNIRQSPLIGSHALAALDVAESVIAIGQSEDGAWLRVLLPANPMETGWIAREFVRSVDSSIALDSLPVTDPNRFPYGNMQSIDIYLDENVDESTALNGVLVQTSPGADVVTMRINGTIFEIEAGSLFFWRGGLTALEAVSVEEQEAVFDTSTNRRLPGTWSSEVLAGTVRVRLTSNQSDEFSTSGTVVSIAGSQISFSADAEALEVGAFSGSVAGSALGQSVDGTQLTTDLSQDEVGAANIPTPTPAPIIEVEESD